MNTRIEGHITGINVLREKIPNALTNYPGFDEYMNLVLDDACEVHLKRKTEKVLFLALTVDWQLNSTFLQTLGRIMLKGDNITLIQARDG